MSATTKPADPAFVRQDQLVRRRYCDDPDNCTYADCPTAFCDRDPRFKVLPNGSHCVDAESPNSEVSDRSRI